MKVIGFLLQVKQLKYFTVISFRSITQNSSSETSQFYIFRRKTACFFLLKNPGIDMCFSVHYLPLIHENFSRFYFALFPQNTEASPTCAFLPNHKHASATNTASTFPFQKRIFYVCCFSLKLQKLHESKPKYP